MAFPVLSSSFRATLLRIQNRIVVITISLLGLLDGLYLSLKNSPATPLRLCCIVAMAVTQRLNCAKWISEETFKNLCVAIDFAANANAIVDNKPLNVDDYMQNIGYFASAGLEDLAQQYIDQLQEIESRKPTILGDSRNFRVVVRYREAVVELSLRFLNGVMRRTEKSSCESEDCQATLRAIAILSQVIDDCLDYSSDLAQGLPGFLTATQRFSESLRLSQQYVRYQSQVALSMCTANSFCFRWVLRSFGLFAFILLEIKYWTQELRRTF